ncbi:hypothetical protein D7X99_07260 [Corallococcus sp. AB032C]|nr:hypothetical protein D7X99_07260 [Corallococcus sp. AB032C]
MISLSIIPVNFFRSPDESFQFELAATISLLMHAMSFFLVSVSSPADAEVGRASRRDAVISSVRNNGQDDIRAFQERSR